MNADCLGELRVISMNLDKMWISAVITICFLLAEAKENRYISLSPIEKLYALFLLQRRGQQIVSVKNRTVNILDSVGRTVSVTTAQLSHLRGKPATDHMRTTRYVALFQSNFIYKSK